MQWDGRPSSSSCPTAYSLQPTAYSLQPTAYRHLPNMYKYNNFRPPMLLGDPSLWFHDHGQWCRRLTPLRLFDVLDLGTREPPICRPRRQVLSRAARKVQGQLRTCRANTLLPTLLKIPRRVPYAHEHVSTASLLIFHLNNRQNGRRSSALLTNQLPQRPAWPCTALHCTAPGSLALPRWDNRVWVGSEGASTFHLHFVKKEGQARNDVEPDPTSSAPHR
jgi:hypothetical protein